MKQLRGKPVFFLKAVSPHSANILHTFVRQDSVTFELCFVIFLNLSFSLTTSKTSICSQEEICAYVLCCIHAVRAVHPGHNRAADIQEKQLQTMPG